MSIGLRSAGIEAKAYPANLAMDGSPAMVRVGEHHMSLEDFLELAHYVLVITDLTENDPRRQFVEAVRKMREIPGYNGGHAKRLMTPLEPVPGRVAAFA